MNKRIVFTFQLLILDFFIFLSLFFISMLKSNVISEPMLREIGGRRFLGLLCSGFWSGFILTMCSIFVLLEVALLYECKGGVIRNRINGCPLFECPRSTGMDVLNPSSGSPISDCGTDMKFMCSINDTVEVLTRCL